MEDWKDRLLRTTRKLSGVMYMSTFLILMMVSWVYITSYIIHIYIQNLSDCLLHICAVYHMSIIPQNKKNLNNRIMTSLKFKRNFSDQKNKSLVLWLTPLFFLALSNNKQIYFSESLPWARPNFEHFTCVSLFNTHNIPMRLITWL